MRDQSYSGGAWRNLIRAVEFWALDEQIVIRIEGHLPYDAATRRVWRGDFHALYDRGELLDDVEPDVLRTAEELLARPAIMDPLRVHRLPDGGYAMQLDLTNPWTLTASRQVVPRERWEGAKLIAPEELPAAERALLAPWEHVVDRLYGFEQPFDAVDEAALAEAPMELDALCDVDGRGLPGRPLRGMQIQVVHGSHPADRTTFDIRRATRASFDVEGHGGTLTFATVDWPRWLARRREEGLLHLCLPGCDGDRCYGCDGSVVGVRGDKAEKARIAAARVARGKST